MIIYHENSNVLDVTPDDDEIILLPHICNNLGGWGAGFVLNLSKKWEKPEKTYRKLFSNTEAKENKLGIVQYIPVLSQIRNIRNQIFVINMIAQNGYKTKDNPHPLDLQTLSECLDKVYKQGGSLFDYKISVHMPKIGSGLGGGNWDEIEKLIESKIEKYKVETHVHLWP